MSIYGGKWLLESEKTKQMEKRKRSTPNFKIKSKDSQLNAKQTEEAA